MRDTEHFASVFRINIAEIRDMLGNIGTYYTLSDKQAHEGHAGSNITLQKPNI